MVQASLVQHEPTLPYLCVALLLLSRSLLFLYSEPIYVPIFFISVKVLKLVTMPNSLTLEFLSVVQEQLTTVADNFVMEKWMNPPIGELILKIELISNIMQRQLVFIKQVNIKLAVKLKCNFLFFVVLEYLN
jgi:hypothetical protein